MWPHLVTLAAVGGDKQIGHDWVSEEEISYHNIVYHINNTHTKHVK